MKIITNILKAVFILWGIMLNYKLFTTLHELHADFEQNAKFIAYGYLAFYFGYAFIVLSPVGDRWINLTIGARKPTNREAEQLYSLNSDLQKTASQKRIHYPKNPVFRVLTEPFPNAMAFGNCTVAFTTGLLNGLSDDEIKAVMAHEIGHIVHKDTLGDLLVNLSFGPLLWIGMLVFRILAAFPLVGIGMAIFLFPAALATLSIWLYYFLKSFTDRCAEFAADKYAVEIAGSDGLIGFLKQIEHLDTVPHGRFLATYMASHPPTAVRIDRIEQMQSE